MKIALLIGSPPMLNYFVNELSRHFPVSLIIREQASIQLKKRLAEKGVLETGRALIRKLSSGEAYQKGATTIFGTSGTTLPDALPIYNTTDINSPDVAQQLATLKPDIVLVNGTSLIKATTLANVPLVLNLHAGLSPYYRGSFCTEWALLNHDPYNIGYTIHRLSSHIDGGDILSQGRPEIKPNDTAQTLHMKLIKEGSQELVSILKRIAGGKQPIYHAQNPAPGFLYLTRHYTPTHRTMLQSFYKEGTLAKMLDKPTRKPLPIIKW